MYGVFGCGLRGDAVENFFDADHAIFNHNRFDGGERPGVCAGGGFPGKIHPGRFERSERKFHVLVVRRGKRRRGGPAAFAFHVLRNAFL